MFATGNKDNEANEEERLEYIKYLREERIRTRPSLIILQLAIILRITILSNDLNSETSVNYASCENCVKN